MGKIKVNKHLLIKRQICMETGQNTDIIKGS